MRRDEGHEEHLYGHVVLRNSVSRRCFGKRGCGSHDSYDIYQMLDVTVMTKSPLRKTIRYLKT